MPRSPILIVSASAGSGHVRAAEAVRASLEAAGSPASHYDVLELAPRWVRTFYGGGFRLLAEHAPRVWRGIYVLADGPHRDAARWGPVANRMLFRSFRRLLDSQAWRYCLSTHFLPAQLAAGTATAPFGLIVTDYTLHRYWVQPRVRDYFVGTPELARAVRRRLPGSYAEATGIPVDPAFRRTDACRARRDLGIRETDRVVLVMGGGFGLGVADSARAALQLPGQDLRVLAVCGTNEEARNDLRAVARTDPRLHVAGFIRDVERYMAAADVVVTKPGGLSTSEALTVGRPLVLTDPIPGHEEANAAFLERSGVALLARLPQDVGRSLHAYFDDPALRLRMHAAVQTLARPDAAARIAAAMESRVQTRVAA